MKKLIIAVGLMFSLSSFAVNSFYLASGTGIPFLYDTTSGSLVASGIQNAQEICITNERGYAIAVNVDNLSTASAPVASGAAGGNEIVVPALGQNYCRRYRGQYMSGNVYIRNRYNVSSVASGSVYGELY